jgi:hypothetical protein
MAESMSSQISKSIKSEESDILDDENEATARND